MPELPLDKGHPHPLHGAVPVSTSERHTAAPVVELHCISCFSFLRGASHPDELVAAAHRLGYEALALTDAASVAGVVRAHVAAKELPIRLVIGSEITTEDGLRCVLLATDRAAYGRLTRLLTVGRRRAEKGRCRLTRADLVAHADGLIAILVPDEGIPDTEALRTLEERARWIAETYGDSAYLGISMNEGPNDVLRAERLERVATAFGMRAVACGGIEAHDASRRALRDVLHAVGKGVRVEDLGYELPRRLAVLRSSEELRRVYAGREHLLEHARAVAERCTFSLSELRYEYPVEGRMDTLRSLAEAGARERWPDGIPAKVRRLLDHEYALIDELGYQDYFLTVHEIVAFARSRGILCQGRGSAANSAVCFCLGITSVDPDRFDVLFERFISKDRHEPPDIDVDFEHDRREEVLQHVYEKYGRERAALTATVITYRGRSAVRDVGKALGLPDDDVARLAETLRWWDPVDWPRERLIEAGFDPDDARLVKVVGLAKELHGFPRHRSQHVGGMIITAGRLDELVPVENASMDGRTVVEWDKDDLDALGILKIDCLALGMLSAIRKALEAVSKRRGRPMGLADVPADDPAVWDMACEGDTIGVFQIESRAQMSMLPRLKPRCFYDLVIEVAIVRPGPIQGGMVHPYLRRRAGEEPVAFPSEAVKEVLGKTLGVPIFQEQAMRLAVVAAGFTPGEADRLRRAMGAWRRQGLLRAFGDKLVEGMLARGYDREFADALFRQITGFGEYGFPESHAASFALLTWVSLWLKRREPAAFLVALLNSQPMGFYAPAQLVADARRHGVTVKPVDVRKSDSESTLEEEPIADGSRTGRRDFGRGGPAVRLGLSMVAGLPSAAIERILAARAERPFLGVDDCRRRADLNPSEAALLARAGAFRGLSEHRRAALWEATTPRDEAELWRSGGGAGLMKDPLPETVCAPDRVETVVEDHLSIGFSLDAHLLVFLRETLAERGAVPTASLSRRPDRSHVAVAGLVLNRQRPATASGILFMTLEDETGHANIIVRVREQERFRSAVLGGRLVLVQGRIERAHGVTHLLASCVFDLSDLLGDVPHASRDFH